MKSKSKAKIITIPFQNKSTNCSKEKVGDKQTSSQTQPQITHQVNMTLNSNNQNYQTTQTLNYRLNIENIVNNEVKNIIKDDTNNCKSRLQIKSITTKTNIKEIAKHKNSDNNNIKSQNPSESYKAYSYFSNNLINNSKFSNNDTSPDNRNFKQNVNNLKKLNNNHKNSNSENFNKNKKDESYIVNAIEENQSLPNSTNNFFPKPLNPNSSNTNIKIISTLSTYTNFNSKKINRSTNDFSPVKRTKKTRSQTDSKNNSRPDIIKDSNFDKKDTIEFDKKLSTDHLGPSRKTTNYYNLPKGNNNKYYSNSKYGKSSTNSNTNTNTNMSFISNDVFSLNYNQTETGNTRRKVECNSNLLNTLNFHYNQKMGSSISKGNIFDSATKKNVSKKKTDKFTASSHIRLMSFSKNEPEHEKPDLILIEEKINKGISFPIPFFLESDNKINNFTPKQSIHNLGVNNFQAEIKNKNEVKDKDIPKIKKISTFKVENSVHQPIQTKQQSKVNYSSKYSVLNERIKSSDKKVIKEIAFYDKNAEKNKSSNYMSLAKKKSTNDEFSSKPLWTLSPETKSNNIQTIQSMKSQLGLNTPIQVQVKSEKKYDQDQILMLTIQLKEKDLEIEKMKILINELKSHKQKKSKSKVKKKKEEEEIISGNKGKIFI